ncbi:MAG: GspE/PulE family protein [Planctomycetota bacterium]
MPLVRLLVERGSVTESSLLTGLGSVLGLEFIDEDAPSPDKHLTQLAPASVVTEYHVAPVSRDGDVVVIAVSDPFDTEAWADLRAVIPHRLRRALATRETISRLIRLGYGLGADTVERLTDNEAHAATVQGVPELSPEAAASEPTVVDLVNRLLAEAVRNGATDLHFEPFEDRLRVRVRVDGVLEDMPLPASARRLSAALVSRVKVMAGLDITERRLPQDGRVRVSFRGADLDLRISVLPGVHGEALNVRVQNRKAVALEFDALGFQPEDRAQIESMISRPHGLVLVTGPTGSGKTTTLYTCLERIKRPEAKVITIEDPVEFWIDGILQMQVHEEIGFTFARALRSMLRHDPEVLLIGEVRDRETADITIRSALTGHLVLATLHTNDAAGAVGRLADIGVEPFLIASSLSGVIAQRLVRRICGSCRRPSADGGWEGAGCERCRGSGFRGRSVICEVMPVGTELRNLIETRATADRIRDAARGAGMRTLAESASEAALAGRTTRAEALRVTEGEA